MSIHVVGSDDVMYSELLNDYERDLEYRIPKPLFKTENLAKPQSVTIGVT